MKKELKVGDRVRVYGWVNMHHSPYTPRYGGPARVTYVDDAGQCHVEFDNECGIHYTAHPKQCRRLRKRERSEQRERASGWCAPPDSPPFIRKLFPTREEAVACVHKNPIHMVELRAGEAVVSRADLARAWDSKVAEAGDPIYYPAKSGVSLTFDAFAKALGLEESK